MLLFNQKLPSILYKTTLKFLNRFYEISKNPAIQLFIKHTFNNFYNNYLNNYIYKQ